MKAKYPSLTYLLKDIQKCSYCDKWVTQTTCEKALSVKCDAQIRAERRIRYEELTND